MAPGRLHAVYLGDEAIVDTRCVLASRGAGSGRCASRSSRLDAAGYTVERARLRGARTRPTLDELERVSARWRGGRPSAGSRWRWIRCAARTMPTASSSPRATRDGHGSARFIHFVPSYGRPAMSLSFMRRDRDTPNGLMEFLVVRAIELLRERGVEELSLNFAAFARWIARARAIASSGRSGASSRSATRSSRSRASTASTRSSGRAGSPATSSTNAGARCRASASPRCASKASSPSCAREMRGRDVSRRWAGALFAALGVLLLPWALWLGYSLPERKVAHHWDWPGEGSTSSSPLRCSAPRSHSSRGRSVGPSFAAATGALLLADAWFDVVTAEAGRDRWLAVTLAAVGEIPLAILCFALARPSRRR